jgi:hypothetical protein
LYSTHNVGTNVAKLGNEGKDAEAVEAEVIDTSPKPAADDVLALLPLCELFPPPSPPAIDEVLLFPPPEPTTPTLLTTEVPLSVLTIVDNGIRREPPKEIIVLTVVREKFIVDTKVVSGIWETDGAPVSKEAVKVSVAGLVSIKTWMEGMNVSVLP